MSEKNRLRVVRAERRITQLALATAARIHPSRVWKIENGYITPNARERQAMAAALSAKERELWPDAKCDRGQ
jgi:transcriptional regulator with XRE-family HTH domain